MLRCCQCHCKLDRFSWLPGHYESISLYFGNGLNVSGTVKRFFNRLVLFIVPKRLKVWSFGVIILPIIHI